MSKENIYPYAVARIRMLEQKILSQQALYQMAEAKSAEDALRIMTEGGTALDSSFDVHDYEKLLSDRTREMYKTIGELVPDENFMDIFLYKNDYHNLKVLLKSELSGTNGDRYLVEGGTLEKENLKKMLENRDFSAFSPVMANAVKDAFELYHKTQSGQTIDIVLDKACYQEMMRTAKESKNSFLIRYVSKLSDLTNLKSFLRIRNMKKGFDAFANVFLEEGTISLDTFEKAFEDSENYLKYFSASDYGTLCEKEMENGFTAFEKACDNYMMDFVREAKLVSLTLEPLVAYVYARETEIKAIRIIMTGKLNNIDSETIKERLRDAYV